MENLLIYLPKKDLELLYKNSHPLDLINNSLSPFTVAGKAQVVIYRGNIHLYFIYDKYKDDVCVHKGMIVDNLCMGCLKKINSQEKK